MKIKKWIILGVVFFTFGIAIPAGAWVFVPPLGDTGWQTFTYTAGENGFTGIAGFVVSNQGDDLVDSWLLIDNLSHGSNPSFENGYNEYILSGVGDVNTGPVIAPFSLNEYYPTNLSYMSYQESSGTDTSNFYNAFGHPGTVGSILETRISLIENEQFTFNWAFITWDTPSNYTGPVGYDFALFYLRPEITIMQSNGNIETYGLAQVVPIPPTLILMGSGLLGIAGIGLRRKKVL